MCCIVQFGYKVEKVKCCSACGVNSTTEVDKYGVVYLQLSDDAPSNGRVEDPVVLAALEKDPEVVFWKRCL